MPRAVVTGAAGFIGSHLSESLLADGWEVTGLDCFSDHYERWLKETNLEALQDEPGFTLEEADLDDVVLPGLIADADLVFHLAARPGVRDSWLNFQDYAAANIVGSKAVFEAAATAGVRVVYASSSSVYGDASSFPVTEASPRGPISPYGASKLMTEILAGAYAASFGLDAVGLRYFTVFGPRQRPDMALSRFIEAIVEERAISIYGDGLQRRDMTFVGDVVAATRQAGEHGRAGVVYNVASGTQRTLLEILGELGEVLDVELDLVHEDAKAGDVRDTWGDISLAAADLGYRPQVALRDGLEQQAAEAERRRRRRSAQAAR
jgi:UDP-glucuronate 4-epimerase